MQQLMKGDKVVLDSSSVHKEFVQTVNDRLLLNLDNS